MPDFIGITERKAVVYICSLDTAALFILEVCRLLHHEK